MLSDVEFMSFMSAEKSSTPMHGHAVKIIRKKCGYDVLYLGKESNRIVKKHSYAVPRMGGNFALPEDAFLAFPFLLDFAECKVCAVRIISAINDSNIFHFKISSMAVTQESLNLASCFDKYGKDSRKQVLGKYNQFNKHSIVCYNVGLHRDVFNKNTASFENKMVIRCSAFNRLQAPWELSRGGGDTNSEFCFALLDWGTNAIRRRTML